MVEQYVIAILFISCVSLILSLVSLSYARKFHTETKRLRNNVETYISLIKKTGKPLDFSISRKRRKRYLVFRVISEKRIVHDEIEKTIKKALSNLYGAPSIKESMLSLVYYNDATGYGILRMDSEWKNRVIASLGFARSYMDNKLLIIPIRSTGTIKRAKNFLFERIK